MDGGRYVVELRREYLTFPDRSSRVKTSLDDAILRAMEQGFQILEDEELLDGDRMRLFQPAILAGGQQLR